MDPTLIAIICFAAIACTVAGLFLLARDVLFNRGSTAVLGRLPLARDERRPRGPISRFDYGFQRTVIESGVDHSPTTAMLVMLAAGVALGGLLFLLLEDPLAAAVGFGVGMLLPLPYYIWKRRQRLKQIQTQLPNVLDLLARAVRAGESLDQAIELLGRKAPEPLAKEFRRCSHQLQMGLSMNAAMRSLAFRIRTTEVKILATTLSVHRTTGGNLAETLERMALVVRERLSYQSQLRATTAAGRFSAALVSIAGLALFAYMFLFQSEYIGRLFSSPFGQSMLLTAIVLEIVGLVWIWRMLRYDY